MRFKFFLLCVLFSVAVLPRVKGLNVFTQSTKGQEIPIIKDNLVVGSWDYKPESGRVCKPPQTMIEQKDHSSRTFTIVNNEQAIISIEVMVADFDERLMDVELSEKEKIILKPDQSHNISIEYKCRNFSLSSGVDWSRVKFIISSQLKGSSETRQQSFSLLKICGMPSQNYDYSIFFLMALSVALVIIGAQMVDKPIMVENEEQTQEITKTHAIAFIFIGSLALLGMFYFYEKIEFILLVIVIISSFTSMSVVLNDFFERSLAYMRRNNPEYRGVSLAGCVSSTIALVVIAIYAFTKNWIVSNLIAFSTVLLMFKVIRVSSYKVACLLLSLAFFYDIYWVFFSHQLFGTSVMATVATKVDLPMVFQCPKLNLSPVPTCSLIGLGDIVLPGIFVSYCLKFSRKLNGNNHYYRTCLVGYVVGLLSCIVSLIVYHQAQPALLYLSPCTLIPVAIHALIKGQFNAIWSGNYDNELKQSERELDKSVPFQNLTQDENSESKGRKKSF